VKAGISRGFIDDSVARVAGTLIVQRVIQFRRPRIDRIVGRRAITPLDGTVGVAIELIAWLTSDQDAVECGQRSVAPVGAQR
jgi:hypothetical protein